MKRPLIAHPLVELAGSLLRPVIPARLWHRYRDWRYAHVGRHAWLAREDKVDGHVDMYWKSIDHPNRTQLVDILVDQIRACGRAKPRVLEFGCHAGMNFKLLHDRCNTVEYFGVEPNHDAAQFLRGKLPFVTLLEAEDREFVAGTFPGGNVDISFVNVVLYSVSAARAKRVIDKLCRTSEVVILGEQLANKGMTSQFESDPEMYTHPYAAWLRGSGFVRQSVVAPRELSPQLSGYLIARR